MIRKSGYRFSEKDHAQTKGIKREDGSKKSHPALMEGRRARFRSRSISFDLKNTASHALPCQPFLRDSARKSEACTTIRQATAFILVRKREQACTSTGARSPGPL